MAMEHPPLEDVSSIVRIHVNFQWCNLKLKVGRTNMTNTVDIWNIFEVWPSKTPFQKAPFTPPPKSPGLHDVSQSSSTFGQGA